MELAYLDICFNIPNIEQWLSSPAEIAPEPGQYSEDEIIKYEVTLVPAGKSGFYFFHKAVNDFSMTLHAIDSNVNRRGIEELEFSWWDGFYELRANGSLVFTASDNDVVEFLQKGRFRKGTLLKEGLTGAVISSGVNDIHCRKVKRVSYRGQLSLSNRLASVSVTRSSNSTRMVY